MSQGKQSKKQRNIKNLISEEVKSQMATKILSSGVSNNDFISLKEEVSSLKEEITQLKQGKKAEEVDYSKISKKNITSKIKGFTGNVYKLVLLLASLVALLYISPFILKINIAYMKIFGIKDIHSFGIESVLTIGFPVSVFLIVCMEYVAKLITKIFGLDNNDVRKDFKKMFEFIITTLLLYFFFVNCDTNVSNTMKALASFELLIVKMWFDPTIAREKLYGFVKNIFNP